MLAALERLGSLSAADPDLLVLLSQTQFVPTASGQLVTPTSLYDPRVPELLELLDASRDLVFPDPDSAFSSEHTLNTLSRLGMRSGVTRLAVLDAARHAELLSIN
jgi:sacsin